MRFEVANILNLIYVLKSIYIANVTPDHGYSFSVVIMAGIIGIAIVLSVIATVIGVVYVKKYR